MPSKFFLHESRKLIHSSEITRLINIKSNDLLWGCFKDGTVRVFNVNQDTHPRVLVKRESQQFNIINEFLGNVVAISESGELFVWNSSFELIQNQTTKHKAVVRCARMNKLRELWTADTAGTIIVWGPWEREFLHPIVNIELNQPVYCMEQVGRVMWLGSKGKIHAVHGFSYTLIATWLAHGGMDVLGMVMTNDAVWTYSDSCPICVWNPATNQLIKTVSDQDSSVDSLIRVFNSHLISYFNTSFSLWNGACYSLVCKYQNAYNSPITCIYYFEGKHNSLITSSTDGVLNIWRPVNKRRHTEKFTGINIEHKPKLRQFTKKQECTLCKLVIRGNGYRCSLCKINFHVHCQSSVLADCVGKPNFSVAFPGIPMYQYAEKDSFSAQKEVSENHCSSSKALKIRIRLFGTGENSEVPILERDFPESFKVATCKADLVLSATNFFQSTLVDSAPSLRRQFKTSTSNWTYRKSLVSMSSSASDMNHVKHSNSCNKLVISPHMEQVPQRHPSFLSPQIQEHHSNGTVIVLSPSPDLGDGATSCLKPSEYICKIPAFDIYLLKEDLPLHRMQYVQACRSILLPPIIDVVPLSNMTRYLAQNGMDSSDLKAVEDYMDMNGRRLFSKDLDLKRTIKQLMGGCPFESLVNRNCDEALDFRRALTQERLKWYNEREVLLAEERFHLPRYYCNQIPKKLVEEHETIQIEGHLSLPRQNSVKKTLLLNCMMTADAALEVLFDAIGKTAPNIPFQGRAASDYLMKVPSLSLFLYGNIPLIHFDYIRSRLSRNRISLRIVHFDEVSKLEETYSKPMEMTLADRILSQKSTVTESKQVSIYTIKDKFSVAVSEIREIPLSSFETGFEEEEKKKDKMGEPTKMMALEASVFFGDLLIERSETASVPAGPNLSFSEGKINFNSIRIQNIARGTRICYTLLLIVGDKRIPLFWVNQQLIFHDTMSNTWSLLSGTRSLFMWEECPKGGVHLYKSIGVCSENFSGLAKPNLIVCYPIFNGVLVFPPIPKSVTPEQVLERLKSPTEHDIKGDLFKLKERLKEPEFKDPFLAQGGLALLSNAIRLLSGNVLSYALGALEGSFEVSLNSGIGWESITIDDITHIVSLTRTCLTDQNPNLNASKSAFRFLSHLIEFAASSNSTHKGFSVVYEAIVSVSRKNNQPPFSMLISGLMPGNDIDIIFESLRLINNLLEFAPSVDKKQQFISSLIASDFNSVMLEVIKLQNMANLRECARYQQIRFEILEEQITSNSSDTLYNTMLMKLCDNAFSKHRVQSSILLPWGDSYPFLKNAYSDSPMIRFLGLRNLLYFSVAHKKDFDSIISQISASDTIHQYSLLEVGIELSGMVFHLFHFGNPSDREMTVFPILFRVGSDTVLEDMFAAGLIHLNKKWFESKTEHADWPLFREKLFEMIRASFDNSPTLDDFREYLLNNQKNLASCSPFITVNSNQDRETKSLSTRMKELDRIIAYDSLTSLSSAEKKTLWQERHLLVNNPNALSKVLLSVDYQNYQQVLQCYQLLNTWAIPTPHQSIELLDPRFTDPLIRGYAVSRLEELKDEECEQLVLQLCQVLKYEAYHDSSLARFLIHRAYRNDKIGHQFFWNLRAELHSPETAERFSLLLEGYIRGCGFKIAHLVNQNGVISSLSTIAAKIKTISFGERKEFLHTQLKKATQDLHSCIGSSLLLAFDCQTEAKSIIVDKCRSMESKQVPLLLVFENSDPLGQQVSAIFKAGDDLRQDALTLQMMRLMDRLWKNAGMNLGLNLYGCVATGNELGMIEVVKNAVTTAEIQREAGGAKGVLRDDVFTQWLMAHNPGKLFDQAQLNFAHSCAGYCVATYVLGIADRHNDNIMITRDGFLFHIDFGHFLGNYKKKFGYQRETTPFVFTTQYAHVLKKKEKTSLVYEKFKDLCTKAYNIVRHEASLFLNLFQLVRPLFFSFKYESQCIFEK